MKKVSKIGWFGLLISWLMVKRAKMEKLGKCKNGFMAAVGGLVALLLTIIIGVLIFWEVNDAIVLGSASANTSRDAVTSMASTIFGLLPLVALVIVASIILGVVLGFGAGNKGV